MTRARSSHVTAVALCALLGACSREAARLTPFVTADAGVAERAASPVAFVDDPVEPLAPTTETVTIRLVADAKRQAQIFWGRKLLGVAPLEVKRPRGSGPLDLLVVAPGYLPLHTRVFTDRDEVLALRLYSDKEAAGLLGYRPPTSE